MKRTTDLYCPHCDANIVKSYGDSTKMRSKLIKWDRNGMVAVCKSCSGDVPIKADFIKSIQDTFVFEIDK